MSKKAKRLTVLGGNGRVGRAAALAFSKAGYQVTLMTRNGHAAGTLSADVSVMSGDAMVRENVVRACKEADLVFNGLNPKYTDWEKFALPMAQNVVEACRMAGATHLFPGNVYNYGSGIPRFVRTDTAKTPDTRKGRIREQMEELFLETAKCDDVQTIIVRAGDFFGGSMKGAWFDEVITASLHKRFMRYPGAMHAPHTWAYLPDLAATFVALAEKRHQLRTYEEFLFPGHTFTGAELKAGIERVLGTTLKSGTLPWWLIRALGLAVPMMREVGEISYLWFKPHQLDGNKLESVIGTIPDTELDTALKASLADLGKLQHHERCSPELRSIAA